MDSKMDRTENVHTLVAQSLRSRIMVTYALCAIADSDVYGGNWERAGQTVKAIRRLIAEIDVLIFEQTGRIPASTIHEAGDLLAELENRTQSIEESLRLSGPFMCRRPL